MIILGMASDFALPFGYLSSTMWLEKFAYHIKTGPEVFVIAILITLAIVLFTVSFQTIKAAMVNTVKAVRNE